MKKTERDINISFTNEPYLNINKIDEVLDPIREVINKNNHLTLRLLVPLSQNRNLHQILATTNDQIQIQYFEHNIKFNAVVFLVDNKFLYVIDIKTDNGAIENFYNVKYTNNSPNVLVYPNLFERKWLSEVSNRVS